MHDAAQMIFNDSQKDKAALSCIENERLCSMTTKKTLYGPFNNFSAMLETRSLLIAERYTSRIIRKTDFAFAKTKALISASVFATLTVQFHWVLPSSQYKKVLFDFLVPDFFPLC